jgi:fumarate hydratase subunit alpha
MNNRIIEKVSNGLVASGSSFLTDKKAAYERAIARETNSQAKWTLETILENAIVAEKNHSPLCDDTGIPHLVLWITWISPAIRFILADGMVSPTA